MPAAVPPLTRSQLSELLAVFARHSTTPVTFLSSLLASSFPEHERARAGLLEAVDILIPIVENLEPEDNPSNARLYTTMHKTMMKRYRLEVFGMTKASKGYHYMAQDLTPKCVAAFSMDRFATDLEESAPLTWDLFGTLVNANPDRRQVQVGELDGSDEEDVDDSDEEEEQGDDDDDDDLWEDEEGHRVSINDEEWESVPVTAERRKAKEADISNSRRRRSAVQRRLALEWTVSALALPCMKPLLI